MFQNTQAGIYCKRNMGSPELRFGTRVAATGHGLEQLLGLSKTCQSTFSQKGIGGRSASPHIPLMLAIFLAPHHSDHRPSVVAVDLSGSATAICQAECLLCTRLSSTTQSMTKSCNNCERLCSMDSDTNASTKTLTSMCKLGAKPCRWHAAIVLSEAFTQSLQESPADEELPGQMKEGSLMYISIRTVF